MSVHCRTPLRETIMKIVENMLRIASLEPVATHVLLITLLSVVLVVSLPVHP